MAGRQVDTSPVAVIGARAARPSAMPSAERRPRERSPILSFGDTSKRSRSAAARSASQFGRNQAAQRSASFTFSESSTVSPLSRMKAIWLVIAGFSHTGWPPMRTSPEVGRRKAAITERRLVLPDPLRPSSPWILPPSRVRLIPSSAVVSP